MVGCVARLRRGGGVLVCVWGEREGGEEKGKLPSDCRTAACASRPGLISETTSEVGSRFFSLIWRLELLLIEDDK
jgi:hypothetical protein